MAYNPNKAAILQRAKSARVRRRQGSLQCARIVLSTNLVRWYNQIDIIISLFFILAGFHGCWAVFFLL